MALTPLELVPNEDSWSEMAEQSLRTPHITPSNAVCTSHIARPCQLHQSQLQLWRASHQFLSFYSCPLKATRNLMDRACRFHWSAATLMQ